MAFVMVLLSGCGDVHFRKQGIMMGWAACEASQKTGDFTMRGNLFDAYMKNFFKTKVKTFGFQDIVDTIDEEYFDVMGLL